MGQLEDYRLFTLIAEHESITKASDALNIAKSAASRRLKLLEERFDEVLIDRTPGHWALTPKGEELYQRVKPLVSEGEELEQDFGASFSKVEGPLRITAPLHLGADGLAARILAFQRQYPEIALTLDLEERLVDIEYENYDFAIRVSSQPIKNSHAHLLGYAKN